MMVLNQLRFVPNLDCGAPKQTCNQRPSDPHGQFFLANSKQSTETKPQVSGTESGPPSGGDQQSFEGDGATRLPKEVIEKLKYTVFGFDTFWVTR